MDTLVLILIVGMPVFTTIIVPALKAFKLGIKNFLALGIVFAIAIAMSIFTDTLSTIICVTLGELVAMIVIFLIDEGRFAPSVSNLTVFNRHSSPH